MAKITRKLQKIFGSNAVTSEMGVFGSFAAGSPTTSSDPETIQSLSNYLDGWFAAILGSNYPAIEDMNALCFLFAYQLSYIMQTGVPEWNAQTVYYIGSVANDGNGVIYSSITDNNLNNILTDGINWKINNKKVSNVQYVIGSAAEVSIGYADYSSIATALTAHPSNASFLISSNYIGAETATITGTNITIQGQGGISSIGGIVCSSNYSMIKNLKITGNATLDSASSACNFSDCWVSSTSVVTDNGANNFVQVIQN